MNTGKRRRVHRSAGSVAYDIVAYTLLTLLAVATIFPFYNVLVVSFTTETAIIKNPLMLWPQEFTLASYSTILSDQNFVRSFFNSLFITVTGTAYSMLLTTCGAFVLTKTHVKGIKFLFGMIVFTMFFGGGLIPTYINIVNLGIVDTFAAVILPAGINTFYMIILINAMRDLPQGLEESAKIDGANEIVTLLRIIIPLCLPTLMAIMLFTIVDKWNEWYSSLLYLTDPKKWPMTYVVRSMLNKITSITDPATQQMLNKKEVFASGLQRAAIILNILPIMVIYPFMQRYFAKGIMVGAIKG